MGSEMPLTAENIIAQLGYQEQPSSNAELAYLSNMNTAELNLFTEAWPRIETERRQHILQRLVELSEDNATLDFDHLFRSCLKDEDAEVRSLAIKGLWENEDASLINPLIQLVEQDSSEAVQVAAVTTLG
jgi:HEAT repeat protein